MIRRKVCYRCHKGFWTYAALVRHAEKTGHRRRRVTAERD